MLSTISYPPRVSPPVPPMRQAPFCVTCKAPDAAVYRRAWPMRAVRVILFVLLGIALLSAADTFFAPPFRFASRAEQLYETAVGLLNCLLFSAALLALYLSMYKKTNALAAWGRLITENEEWTLCFFSDHLEIRSGHTRLDESYRTLRAVEDGKAICILLSNGLRLPLGAQDLTPLAAQHLRALLHTVLQTRFRHRKPLVCTAAVLPPPLPVLPAPTVRTAGRLRTRSGALRAMWASVLATTVFVLLYAAASAAVGAVNWHQVLLELFLTVACLIPICCVPLHTAEAKRRAARRVRLGTPDVRLVLSDTHLLLFDENGRAAIPHKAIDIRRSKNGFRLRVGRITYRIRQTDLEDPVAFWVCLKASGTVPENTL